MSKLRFELELFGRSVFLAIEQQSDGSVRIMTQRKEPSQRLVAPEPQPTPDLRITPALIDDDLLSLITIVGQSTVEPASAAPTEMPISLDSELAQREYGRRDAQIIRNDVDIQIVDNALAGAVRHGQTSRQEVGGFCIGRAVKVQDHWRITITATFAAQGAISRPASFTLTPDSWSEAHKTVEAIYTPRGEYIVGWYHTHPGFGVFFSSMDHFVHENYFTQPWHVALVIDPYRSDQGFFAWYKSKDGSAVSRCRHSVIPPVKEDAPAKKEVFVKEDVAVKEDASLKSDMPSSAIVPLAPAPALPNTPSDAAPATEVAATEVIAVACMEEQSAAAVTKEDVHAPILSSAEAECIAEKEPIVEAKFREE